MKRDGIFSWIKLDALKAWLNPTIAVNDVLRYNSAKTFGNPQDIPDYATVQSMLGSGINSQLYSEADLISDGGGGYYLPYSLASGEIPLGVLIDYGLSQDLISSPSYDFVTGAITGFPSNAGQSIKVFATGIFVPPTPPPPAPVFSLQPTTPLTILHLDVLTLNVAASDTTSYQWYKDGIALVGQTGATLTVSPFFASDAGTYRVDAIGAGGLTSSNNSVVSWDFGKILSNVSKYKSDGTPNGVGRNITYDNGTISGILTPDYPNDTVRFRSNTTSIEITQAGVDDLTLKDGVHVFAPILGGSVVNTYNAPFEIYIDIFNDN